MREGEGRNTVEPSERRRRTGTRGETKIRVGKRGNWGRVPEGLRYELEVLTRVGLGREPHSKVDPGR